MSAAAVTRGLLPDVSEAEYHADPCEAPSLTRSIAHLLVVSSPLHAWHAHPQLNPDHVRVEAERFDVGTVAHAVLLGGQSRVAIIEANDWRTAEAKDARDRARRHGQIPLLAKHWANVQAMVGAAKTQLERLEVTPPPFTDGAAETTIVWDEPGGVVCRARLDWLRNDRGAIDDYKTTSRSANPEAFARAMFGAGYDMQAAFYLRGLARLNEHNLRAGGTEFRFVVQETAPPYALSVVGLSPDTLAVAHAKVAMAIDRWRDCLERGAWPGYPPKVHYATLPPWEEARVLELMGREA